MVSTLGTRPRSPISPGGTADGARRISAVPSGLVPLDARTPNVETLGYYRPSLRDDDDGQFLAAWDILVGVFSGCPCMACLRRSGRGWQTNRPLKPKSETRKPKRSSRPHVLRISDFGFPSDFGFRASDLSAALADLRTDDRAWQEYRQEMEQWEATGNEGL